LKDGLAVEVRATASIYEARGEFQLNVETIRLAGVGALYEKFERLKARLAAAGWFAAERKRPLPRYPRVVGVVTSMRAAALRDILETLERRWPMIRVIVYPTSVQGGGAAAEIAAAISAANAHAGVDVLIVARGGGSIEDLWAFNEEAVARAVFESRIPVVSGVGHETDFTICDFVADARAPTPTGAATLVVPDRHPVLASVAAIARRWQRAGTRVVERQSQRLDAAARRLLHPAAKLALQRRDVAGLAGRLARVFRGQLNASRQRTGDASERLGWRVRQPLPQRARLGPVRDALGRAMATRFERSRAKLDALEQSLVHLNPREVLERGYAIVTSADGAVVDDAARLKIGDDVSLALARGSAGARITRRDPG
jgi:exodeoxyribonuclease VII large subunit